jgi:hypothetical protein
MVQWAILNFHTTGYGALAIYNFWFGEPPSFDLSFDETEKRHPRLQVLV